jgi:hypothetical protein
LLRSHPSMFFDALVPFALCVMSREVSSALSRDAPDFRCILDLSFMTLSLRWQKNAPGKVIYSLCTIHLTADQGLP